MHKNIQDKPKQQLKQQHTTNTSTKKTNIGIDKKYTTPKTKT